jgi:metal-responsive CopG/Arc/MetJ family transcriptional regulator
VGLNIIGSIATRFPRETIERVSKFAKEQKVSRSEAIRRLVERALAELKA